MSKYLWSKDDLIEALDGVLIAGRLQDANGISIDSREINKEDAFFAIKGELFDGHAYCENAIKAGVSVVVISNKDACPKNVTPDDGIAVILVDDVLESLGRLAVASRLRSKAKIVAITGSVGKTSTKEYLKACLEQVGVVHASIKSFNNHWGVPISLARMPQNAEFGVFEIGMNHLNEITPLVKMVMPDIAIITTVAPAHLGHFKDLEQIALAKSEIFDGMGAKSTAILNIDNEYFDFLSNKARLRCVTDILSFGQTKNADFKLLDATLLPQKSEIVALYKGDEIHYMIGSAGMHQVKNSLAVMLCLKKLGVDIVKAKAALASIELSDGRGAQSDVPFKGGTFKLIDESYNANPASMVAAFSVLDAQNVKDTGRKIAIIGDMLELGDATSKIHAQLAEAINDSEIDLVMACGVEMRHCFDNLDISKKGIYAENSSKLGENILDKVQPHDVVMVKGSLGSKMSIIINKLKSNL